MPELYSNRRLDQPRAGRSRRLTVDPDAFARMSERIARFLGTGRYLAIQTVIVVVWIALNLLAVSWRWDPYPFILLNLAFSTQAAYAAPLILLAQNRQDDRDRVALDEDRARAERTKADTEYLARELASLRIAVGEVATRDYLRGELEKLAAVLTDSDPRASRIELTPRAGRGDSTTRAGQGERGARANRTPDHLSEHASDAAAHAPDATTDRQTEAAAEPNPPTGRAEATAAYHGGDD